MDLQSLAPKAPPKHNPVHNQGELKSLRLGTHTFDLTKSPLLMGILNITPDSFSDGGLYLDPARAEEQALRLEDEGADILDVGAESSKPGSKGISAEEELKRIIPVLKKILPKLKIPVSVDTAKYEVMQSVLDLGVSVINDIRAMQEDTRIPKLIAAYKASVVLMHMRGTPVDMQVNTHYGDVVEEVVLFLERVSQAALRGGIPQNKIILDPGIGFGKSVEGNFELINSVDRIKALGFSTLIGLSKKSFMQKLFQRPGGDLKIPMAVLHALVLKKGADILRAHDMIDAKMVVDLCAKWEQD